MMHLIERLAQNYDLKVSQDTVSKSLLLAYHSKLESVVLTDAAENVNFMFLICYCNV